MRRAFTAALMILAIALPVCAQRRGMGGARGGGSFAVRSYGHRGFRIGGGIAFGHNPRWHVVIGSHPRYRIRPYRRVPYAYPYAYPYSYPYVTYPAYPLFDDTLDSTQYVTAAPQPEYARPAPQVIYVPTGQVGLDQQMRQQGLGIYRPPAQPQSEPAPAAAAAPPPPEQPLTVLIYRDGRRSEVRNYAIVGPTLWIFNEQRAHKVALASLDLNATRKTNEERGVEFSLPPASNSPQ